MNDRDGWRERESGKSDFMIMMMRKYFDVDDDCEDKNAIMLFDSYNCRCTRKIFIYIWIKISFIYTLVAFGLFVCWFVIILLFCLSLVWFCCSFFIFALFLVVLFCLFCFCCFVLFLLFFVVFPYSSFSSFCIFSFLLFCFDLSGRIEIGGHHSFFYFYPFFLSFFLFFISFMQEGYFILFYFILFFATDK